MAAKRIIVAEMSTDTVPGYAGGHIPVVLYSTHPRFVEGTRFDYGFLQIALAQGFDVTIYGTPRRERKEGHNG